MIALTRLNDRRFIINAEQIKTIEETPDTLVTLLNGDQMLVKERMAEVVQRAIEYGRLIRTFQVPVDPRPPDEQDQASPRGWPSGSHGQ